ncbi:DUF6276 family protein [Halorussus sp. MSC15.2]|uniref:DUF6276 family protein n=1 Tax=Halorussus sp. MSC15.2 TaxID=2283638 RepID=UPI0013D6FF37|nr:DUF6276 family protein [Halorussus sp. MSC15.2]NEU58464.1 hypothetical protein [Halorussus sp. MSC15.2]
MTCPDCGSERVTFGVPEDLRESLPEQSASATLCTHCLRLDPTDAATQDDPDFSAVSDAFPGGDAGVAMALAVGLLDSLALYRSEIADLLERVERGGTDPLLVLDRLAADPEIDPTFDPDRRRTQAEQLLYE